MKYMRKRKEGCEGRSHGSNYPALDFSGPFPPVKNIAKTSHL